MLPDRRLILPTPENILELRQPVNWMEHMALDDESRIERKAAIARALGVPAVLFLKEDVDTRIAEMATVLHASGITSDDLFVGVELGGLPFFNQLLEDVSTLMPYVHPMSDTIEVSRYQRGQSGSKKPGVSRHLKKTTEVAGKRIHFIDELIDEGGTINYLVAQFMKIGGYRKQGRAQEVTATFLAEKGIADFAEIQDLASVLIGFTIANVWASGKGMDGENNAFRHNPHILVSPAQDIKYLAQMAETLEILGPRTEAKMDTIVWLEDERKMKPSTVKQRMREEGIARAA